MGIGFVLLIYIVVLTGAACLGALVLRALTSYLIGNATQGRMQVLLAPTLFPFFCVVFAGALFVVYAVINTEVFDRDPGIGDSSTTPLPNGYALLIIDTPDQGMVYNPKTQSGHGSFVDQDDALSGVRQLQISNQLIFGARDSKYFDDFGKTAQPVDTYFELDTNKKTHTEFKSLRDLQVHAASEGVILNLQDFWAVFNYYRNTWFDYTSFATLLLVPLAGFIILAHWIWKVRQAGELKHAADMPA